VAADPIVPTEDLATIIATAIPTVVGRCTKITATAGGGDDLEIIAPTDLARSRSSMNLTELKKRPISDLVKLAEPWV